MLQETTLSVNFGQGLDSKTDPKMTIGGELVDLQNAVFTNAKRITKRNGYASMTTSIVGGGTITSPKLVKAYLNEIIIGAENSNTPNQKRLFSYSQGLDKWVDKGKLTSIAVSDRKIFSGTHNGTSNLESVKCATSALLGNYQLYVYTMGVAGAPDGRDLYYSVLDRTTNTFLAYDVLIGNNIVFIGTPVIACTLGSTAFAIFYIRKTPDFDVVSRLVTVNSSGVTLGAVVTVGTNAAGDAVGIDVVNTPTGAFLAYVASSSAGGASDRIKIATVDTTGVTTHSATISSTNTAGVVSLTYDPTSTNTWIYWADLTTVATSIINAAIYSNVAVQVLAPTSLKTNVAYPTQIVSEIVSTTSQNFYYSYGKTYYSGGTQTSTTLSTSKGSLTSAGVVTTPTAYAINYCIYTKPITVNGVSYMAIKLDSSLQPNCYLIDTSDGAVVAKFLAGEGPGAYQFIGLTGSRFLDASNNLVISGMYQIDSGTANVVTSAFSPHYGVVSSSFNFSNTNNFQCVVAGTTAMFNGGVISAYDSASINELGFNNFIDLLSIVKNATGSSLAAGAYGYTAIYEYTDSRGNLYQSAPAPAVSVNNSAGDTNTITVTNIGLTQKPTGSITISLYRTETNGSVYRYVASVPNDPTTQTQNFIDSAPTLVGNQFLYTTGGVVENIQPPPSMIMSLIENRIMLVDSENPTTDLWYSKTLSTGNGIGFNDSFVVSVEPKFGEMTGLAGLDEKTVILKEQGNLFFVGSLGNDTGTGSSVSQIQSVPSDTGCNSSKSIFVIPQGVICKTPKGIYLLDRSINFQYWGAKVEGFNSQDVTAATMISDKNQIRFLTSSGSSLVYDYFFNQWSNFTNHQGYSADVWGGVYVYVRTDGLIFKESSTSFLDNATSYKLRAQTAWLKLNAIQGFMRVRRFAFLGDFASASNHGVQVSAAYDFGTTFSTPVQYLFTGSNGYFQYRERLPRQKCNSLQLIVEEVTTGASGEYVDFSDLTFEAGMKKGVNRLPLAQTVG